MFFSSSEKRMRQIVSQLHRMYCMRKYMFRVFVSSNKETNIESTPMWISLPIHFEGMDGGGCCVVEWWCSSSSAGVISQWQGGGSRGVEQGPEWQCSRTHSSSHSHNTQHNAPEQQHTTHNAMLQNTLKLTLTQQHILTKGFLTIQPLILK